MRCSVVGGEQGRNYRSLRHYWRVIDIGVRRDWPVYPDEKEMIDFIVQYWWHILAVCVSPLAGFAWSQMFKVSRKNKPSAYCVAIFNAVVTTVFSFILWPGDIIEKTKMALTIGSIWPFLILGWFIVAKRYAPEQYESLTGSNGDVTIMPGLKIKKKDQDITQPRD